MEDNKLIILFAIVAVIIVIIAATIGLFFYFKMPAKMPIKMAPAEDPALTTNANTNANEPAYLPTTPETPEEQLERVAKENLEKEKRFVSTYWEPFAISYTADAVQYKLPLTAAKEQVANYRDLSRKISFDHALPLISQNGFAVIGNPFKLEANDWAGAYETIQKINLPIIITADSVAGIYQTTLGVIYRETEQEIFYASLWEMLKEMFDQCKARYDAKRRVMGIESDAITEANRLELAYLTVALKVLQPDPKQIREALAGDDRFFSSLEKEKYVITVPKELETEIAAEIKLIATRPAKARSPIMLYDKSYLAYEIPSYYRSSEKLKNYYLAATWLNDIIFPLWSKADNCANCLLDQQDHGINFLAGLFLSNDLASNQNLKNRWANIYKTVGFLRGIETNLTYLYYDQALTSLYGQDYDLYKIFAGSADENKKEIAKLQKKIDAYQFPPVLSGPAIQKEYKGLRLLRNRYLPEAQLTLALSGEKTGKYTVADTSAKNLPFTACGLKGGFYRCWPTGLDLFNFLGNTAAKTILDQTKNDKYEFYRSNLDGFAANFKTFEGHAWHDNAYLSLLWSFNPLKNKKGAGFPTFMQTPAWANKQLNATLGVWTDFHREINTEKNRIPEENTFTPLLSYGYVEPEPEFYGELKANVEMIMTGFASLQIITPRSRQYERLSNLKLLLENMIRLSTKELAKDSQLSKEDYDYINNFGRQIKVIYGDISKTSLQNKYSFPLQAGQPNGVNEFVDGFNYLIAVYPQSRDKILFALGPVYNYSEGKVGSRSPWPWQKEFLIK
jgi:hypothetical protein